jgi:hypothetical protein
VSEPEREGGRSALYAGFVLALRVCRHVYHPYTTTSEQAKLWEVMDEIAAGHQALVTNPAEIEQTLPLGPEERESIWSRANERASLDREHARAILAELDEVTQGRRDAPRG